MSSSMAHSRCVQIPVSDVKRKALEIFQSQSSENGGQIPLVLIPKHRALLDIYLSVPTGCFCLLQKWGAKEKDVATPGLYVKPPWWRIAYVVSQASCTYNAPVQECPTADNVRVGVDIVIVFAIRDPQLFVYKLGAMHFDQLLAGAVSEATRKLVRGQRHHDVFFLRGNRADGLLMELNSKFNKYGVVFSNVTVKDVTLPDTLRKSLEHTTEMRKSMEKTRREHASQIGELERASDMELEQLRRTNENIIVQENGKKLAAELEHDKLLVKAEQDRNVKILEAQSKVEIQKKEALATKDRNEVDMKRYRVDQVAAAENEAEAKRVRAEVEFTNAQMDAEAEKQKLLGQAKALTLDAQAEAEAARNLVNIRKHELEMREKEILKKLAEKANYNLIGEHGDKMVGALLTGSLAADGSAGPSGPPPAPSSGSGWGWGR